MLTGLPLSNYLGPGSAIMIVAILFTAVLIPILLSKWFPTLNRPGGFLSPPMGLPIISAAVAVVCGMVIIIARYSLFSGLPEACFPEDDFSWWCAYASRWHWSLFHGLLPALLALRMQYGGYPATGDDTGKTIWLTQWGDVKDALIVASGTLPAVVLIALMVNPNPWGNPVLLIRPVVIGTVIAFVLGFFVPTWYRAHRKRIREEAVIQQP